MDFYHRPNRLFLAGDLRHGNGSVRVTPHRNGYLNEASFDTNMVIILAALLCALLCALGLNSIVRCVLRFGRRFGLDDGEAAAAVSEVGLKKSSLKEIPVRVYGSGANIPGTDCPICLGEFMDGEKVRVLPKCHHGFHVRCIDVWLAAHPSCPTCRRSLIEPTPPDAAADVEAGLRQPAAPAVEVAG